LDWLTRLSEPPLAVPCVALLGENDHEIALRCLRIGACGCLIRPFDGEQLLPLLLRVGYHESAPEDGGRRKVLCVMPAKGSSGATTLAANLACQASRAGFERILLADLDSLTGTLAFTLKLKSPYSIVDALAHAEELDADLWRGLVAPYRGLDVLLAPDNPLGCDVLNPATDPLMSYARRAYDLVVLDTGGAFIQPGLDLARLSDEILLVTTSEPGSVHAAKRTLGYLATNGVPHARIKLVVSRWRRDLGFERDEIEAALGMEVFHVLPSDPQAVEDALLEGRPIAAGSSFGKSLAELGLSVLGKEQPSERPTQQRRKRTLLSLGL
jgi:pilus assembly protein CpaE